MKGKILAVGNNLLKVKLDIKDFNKFFNADGTPNKKRMDIELNYIRRKRTPKQNRYMHALYDFLKKNNMAELLEHGGETRSEYDLLMRRTAMQSHEGLHNYFKMKATQDQIIPNQYLDENQEVSTKILDVYYMGVYINEFVIPTLVNEFHIDLTDWYAYAEQEGIEKPKLDKAKS